MIENIVKLALIDGVSGMEHKVSEEIIAQLTGICELSIDNLGNVIAYKKGKSTPKNKIMLSAHMDEVGFIITYIEDSGLMRFSTCGGIDPRVVVGKRVHVGENKILGIIGTKAFHQKTQEERDNTAEFSSLFIDIGAKNKEETLELISLGDRAAFESQYTELGNGLFICKALDDRAGCGILIELLKTYDEYDIYGAFTVQEESGCTGAKPAATAIKPNIGLILETTTAGDVGGTSEDKQVCRLGNGAVVSFMDKKTVYDHNLYTTIMNIGKENGIPVQTKEGVFGGNESLNIQTSNAGVRVCAISLPCRYLHSASCVLKKDDIENTLLLLKKSLPILANI